MCKKIFAAMIVGALSFARADLPGIESHEATLTDLFTSKVFRTPEKEENFAASVLQRQWKFADPDRANITYYSDGIKDVRITEDGALRFRVDGTHASLGWGNVDGCQPAAERIALWASPFTVKLEMRQTNCASSTWTLRVFTDGEIEALGHMVHGGYSKSELSDHDWQTISLDRSSQYRSENPIRSANGFMLDITSEPGAEFEIRRLDVVRTVTPGYYRAEIDIPEGKIWRAIATIGNGCLLSVNGREISDSRLLPSKRGYLHRSYHTTSVDLAPYLRSGRNCLALRTGHLTNPAYLYGFGSPGYSPYVCLQGQAVMDSGETVEFGTDENWQWRDEQQPEWNTVGFDAKSWCAVGNESSAKTNARAMPADRYIARRKLLWERPAYDGCLVIENPYESRLLYAETNRFAANVLIPAGYADKSLALTWNLYRVRDGAPEKIYAGTATDFSAQSSGLMFKLEHPPLPSGVYTIHLALQADGETVATRIPEPFLVAGNVPMLTVAGNTYTQGMDMELETTIDFTDSDDPHPWVESDTFQEITEPRLVEKDGLKYRETRLLYNGNQCSPSSFFAYNMRFKHPGDWYMMQLEYPDNQERHIGVCLTSAYADKLFNGYSGGVGVYTGGRLPVTGQMRTLNWIYRADDSWTAVNVLTLLKNTPAAANCLRVYHIKGHLPALQINDAGARHIGSLTEGISFPYAFAPRTVPATSNKRPKPGSRQPVLEACRWLQKELDTAEHYVEYLRFRGENVAAINFYQYDDYHVNTLYGNLRGKPDGHHTARIPMDTRHITTRVMRENGIDVLASIQFVISFNLAQSPGMRVSDMQVQAGADTCRPVSGDGQQVSCRQWMYPTGNFLHPETESVIFQTAEEIASAFKDQPNFKGVCWWNDPFGSSPTQPSFFPNRGKKEPFLFTYDDVTIQKFEQDTGILIPATKDDPERFQKRAAFLTSGKMLKQWTDWRSQKTSQFFAAISARLQKLRPDLTCVPILVFRESQTYPWRSEEGVSLQEFMNNWGWNPECFIKDDVWLAQMFNHNDFASGARKWPLIYGLNQNAGADFFKLYYREHNRAAMVHHGWTEVEKSYANLPKRENWANPAQFTMYSQARDEFAREQFTQALIGSDPELMLYGFMDCGYMVGNEQPLREFAQTLRALPAARLHPVAGTGLDSNLAINLLQQSNTCWMMIANPGYWPVTGQIRLKGAAAVTDLTAVNNSLYSNGVLTVELPPYGAAAFRVKGANVEVTGWETAPLPAPATDHLRNILGQTRNYLANKNVQKILTQDELALVRNTADEMESALAEGDYARAWARSANRGNFWQLFYRDMHKIVQYKTKIELADVNELPIINVPKTAVAPELDGRIDEPFWRNCPIANDFVTHSRWTAPVSTKLRMAYDKHYLYIAVTCEDSDPEAIQAFARDAKRIFRSGDDVVVFFIQPDPAQPRYYQLAFNTMKVQFNQRVDPGVVDYKVRPDWRVAIGRTEQAWTAEVAIKLDDLGISGAPGRVIRGNVFRITRAGLADDIATSWSWVSGNFHDTSRFGEWRLAD